MPLLNVALVPAPDQVVVRLTDDADLSIVPLLTDALARAAGLGTRRLVVDVATVRFWDSSALRTLAAVSTALGNAGRSCRIVGAGPATRRLIRAADLGSALHLDGPVVELVSPESAAPAASRPARHAGSARQGRVTAIPLHRWS